MDHPISTPDASSPQALEPSTQPLDSKPMKHRNINSIDAISEELLDLQRDLHTLWEKNGCDNFTTLLLQGASEVLLSVMQPEFAVTPKLPPRWHDGEMSEIVIDEAAHNHLQAFALKTLLEAASSSGVREGREVIALKHAEWSRQHSWALGIVNKLLEPSGEPEDWAGIAFQLNVNGGELQAWSPLEAVVAKVAQRVIGSVCGHYPSGVSAAIERDRTCRETVTRGESLPSDVDDISEVIDLEGFYRCDSRAALIAASRKFAAETASYDDRRNKELRRIDSYYGEPVVPEVTAQNSRQLRARARRDES